MNTGTKKIPLRYQKRYLANITGASFNSTIMTGFYKNKVKTLLKNNKCLALALQKDREKKEELLAESKTNAELIMFSKLNLVTVSSSLKKIIAVVDETVSLLDKYSTSCLQKFTPQNTLGRKEFKHLINEIPINTIPEEIEATEVNTKEQHEKRKTISTRCKSKKLSSVNEENIPMKKKCLIESEDDHSMLLDIPAINLRGEIRRKDCSTNCQSKKLFNDEPTISIYNNEDSEIACLSKSVAKDINSNCVLNEKLITQTPSKGSKKTCNKNRKNKTAKSVKQKIGKNQTIKYKTKSIPISPEKNNLSKFSEIKENLSIENFVDISQKPYVNKSEESFTTANKSLDKMFNANNSNDCLPNMLQNSTITNSSNNSYRSLNKSVRFADFQDESPVKKPKISDKTDCSYIGKQTTALKNLSNTINIGNLEAEKKTLLKTTEMICTSESNNSVTFRKRKNILDLSNEFKIITKNKKCSKRLDSTLNETTQLPSNNLKEIQSVISNKEIINSAKHTLLVTAEIHSEEDLQNQNNEINLPVVLITDIFKHNKTLCKNISSYYVEQNQPSLELVQVCSPTVQNKSDVIESSSQKYFDNDKFTESSNSDKRSVRRRRSLFVNYKEPLLNKKLRR